MSNQKGCPVCQHAERGLIEASIYGLVGAGGSNEDVAARFEIRGRGGATAAEVVRQHRLDGHMRPREEYVGRPLLSLVEETE